MNLFKGVGKAGTGILGGVTKGVGKVVETVGDVAEKAPVVGGVGTVVEGAGKAIEEAGEATEDFGEKAFENKENKPKKGLKEVILGQMEEDYGRDDGPMEEDDDANEDDYNRDDLYKQYDAEMARRTAEGGVDDDEIDEAEEKLIKDDDGGAVLEDSDEEEESAKIIPKYFSLKSMYNNKYLRYISESEESDGLLRYSSKNIVGPYSKFAVRASKTQRGFFHIRCCYNNKFWARKSEDSKYIAAVANEEEDDQSKWSCTLYEPIFVPEKNGHYLRHVQLNMFLCLADGDPAPYNDCLAARVEDLTTIDEKLVLFAAVDWESIFILPKYVAFKSNNDEYLEPSGKYLKFSASNVEDPAVAFEVISMQDGYVRIKHVKSGKYWIRDPNWIWCESINTEKDNPNTLFWPVKVDSNVVAFRNKGNNHFCKRLTTEGKTNCLNAAVATITDTARLEVTEVVIARSVEDVEYRVNDARIYGKKVVTVSNGIAINNTEVDDKVTLKFRYQEKVERTWSTSVSSTFGIATKFTSKIPTVGTLKFELSLEVSKGSTREETETEKSFVESAETITIPRMSKVKFSAMVTTASCDVPFSYTRRDTLKDGRQVTHHLEDGIFTGVSTYDYKFETEKLPL